MFDRDQMLAMLYELRDQLLYEMGVTVDDKANTWQCSDGRRG